MTSAVQIARHIITALSVPDNANAWWDLYDRFVAVRQTVVLLPGRSPSGKPFIQVNAQDGSLLFRCIMHGSVLPALRLPHKYTPTLRQYYVTPATETRVVEYWAAAVARFMHQHANDARYARARHMYQADATRVLTVAATLPWTEQGSRPSINWNAVGLSFYGVDADWTWLARGVSRYGYGFTAAGCAYSSRIGGETAYLSTVLGSNTYSAYLDPARSIADGCARTLTTWKRGGNVPSDPSLYASAAGIIARTVGGHG